MLKIMSGIIKKVLTEEQYKKVIAGELRIEDIELESTLQVHINEDKEEIKYLPFRLSYKEIDHHGNDKFIFNEDTQEYKNSYRTTPIIYAYGKELRILLETVDFNPVKIVVEEQERTSRTTYRAVCIQDQLKGLARNYE